MRDGGDCFFSVRTIPSVKALARRLRLDSSPCQGEPVFRPLAFGQNYIYVIRHVFFSTHGLSSEKSLRVKAEALTFWSTVFLAVFGKIYKGEVTKASP